MVHAARMRNGVCTWRATTAGFMKIPEPMMPPMTIIVASKRPRRRASAGVESAAERDMWCFFLPQSALSVDGF
jgi:hypothetical protein